jgi:hypothetical protein
MHHLFWPCPFVLLGVLLDALRGGVPDLTSGRVALTLEAPFGSSDLLLVAAIHDSYFLITSTAVDLKLVRSQHNKAAVWTLDHYCAQEEGWMSEFRRMWLERKSSQLGGLDMEALRQ